MSTLYSFKDVAGVFYHPLVGSYIIGGGDIGLDEVELDNTTEKTVIDKSSDGSTMISYVTGDLATAKFTVQQTGDLHFHFLNLYNLIKTQADLGNIAGWTAATFSLRSLLDQSKHNAKSVCFQKVPPKSYKETGQKLSWNFVVAELINE